MVGRDAAAQQIPREPAARVVEGDLGGHRLGAVGAAQVVGLHQPGRRVDGADRLHREHGSPALVQHGGDEGPIAAGMRIPDAVEAAEPGRRYRFVDGRPVVDPGKPLCDRRGEPRQPGGEPGIEQAGVAGPAAVVHQADDGRETETAQGRQALVGEAPVGLLDRFRRCRFPEHRVADGADPERGEALEIVVAQVVPASVELRPVDVAHAIDGAFHTAPHLQRLHSTSNDFSWRESCETGAA